MSKKRKNRATQPDAPAFRRDPYTSDAMTKREFFSLQIVNGLLSDGHVSSDMDDEEIALQAVDIADALMRVLNETESDVSAGNDSSDHD